LAAVGLIETTNRALLGAFLKEFILSRPDVKPATLEVWQQPCRNLITYFGDEKPLRNITAGNGDQFKAWLLTQKLAAATVAKRLSFARTFLHVARKHKLIDENPFAEVKIPMADVSRRQQFISRDSFDRMIDVASPTWRTIIALARFGGLRCPSEVLSLEWRHIDWQRGRLTVPSPKTERYDGKGSRELPLFPELREHLQEAFEQAEPAQARHRGESSGEGIPGDRLERLQSENDVHETGEACWPGAVATPLSQFAEFAGNRVAGTVPGPRRRPVDGARCEGEPEALRPDDGSALREGVARCRKRCTRAAKNGAATSGSE
jgi:integrase